MVRLSIFQVIEKHGERCGITFILRHLSIYQRVFFDRLVGTGQVSDYLKPKAPASDPDFEPLPDEDDVPF